MQAQPVLSFLYALAIMYTSPRNEWEQNKTDFEKEKQQITPWQQLFPLDKANDFVYALYVSGFSKDDCTSDPSF